MRSTERSHCVERTAFKRPHRSMMLLPCCEGNAPRLREGRRSLSYSGLGELCSPGVRCDIAGKNPANNPIAGR